MVNGMSSIKIFSYINVRACSFNYGNIGTSKALIRSGLVGSSHEGSPNDPNLT